MPRIAEKCWSPIKTVKHLQAVTELVVKIKMSDSTLNTADFPSNWMEWLEQSRHGIDRGRSILLRGRYRARARCRTEIHQIEVKAADCSIEIRELRAGVVPNCQLEYKDHLYPLPEYRMSTVHDKVLTYWDQLANLEKYWLCHSPAGGYNLHLQGMSWSDPPYWIARNSQDAVWV